MSMSFPVHLVCVFIHSTLSSYSPFSTVLDPRAKSFFLTSMHSLELSHSPESDLPSCRLSRISLIWLSSSWLYPGCSGDLVESWTQGQLSPAPSAPELSPGRETIPKASCLGSFRLF